MLQIGRNGVVVTECNKLSGRNPGQHYPPPPHFQRKSQRCISEKTSKVFGVNQFFFAQDHRGDGLNQSRQRRDIFWRTASAVKIHSQRRKKEAIRKKNTLQKEKAGEKVTDTNVLCMQHGSCQL